MGKKYESNSLLILMVKDESESPTDETFIVLLKVEHVPTETLQVVLEVTVKSIEGAVMETEVSALRKDECMAKGVLIVIVILEFS